MARLSAKLRSVQTGHAHWCPGCEEMHILPARWTFDGNVEAPTFSPSFKHSWGPEMAKVCHYILTAGKLNYCDDSTAHQLRGEVDLPDIPDGETLGLAGYE